MNIRSFLLVLSIFFHFNLLAQADFEDGGNRPAKVVGSKCSLKATRDGDQVAIYSNGLRISTFSHHDKDVLGYLNALIERGVCKKRQRLIGEGESSPEALDDSRRAPSNAPPVLNSKRTSGGSSSNID